MQNRPYTQEEYQLMLEKIENFCGEFSNALIFEELSNEVDQYSKNHSINLWNQKTANSFINHLRDKWQCSYCATIAIESVLKELIISYPHTTFTHIAKTLRTFSF